jgi:hypothetical protein
LVLIQDPTIPPCVLHHLHLPLHKQLLN